MCAPAAFAFSLALFAHPLDTNLKASSERSPHVPNFHEHWRKHKTSGLALLPKLHIFHHHLILRSCRAATHTHTLKGIRLLGVCDCEV